MGRKFDTQATEQPDDSNGDTRRADGVATIEDVARMAGVSPATVSRVINARPIVREQTRRRVLDAIAALRFQPNLLGRSLATQRTNTLGVVVTDITNLYHTEIVRGIETAAIGCGMSVLLYDTAEEEEREEQALRLLSERHVDGVIITSARLPADRIESFARSGMPLALINRSLIPGIVGVVETDQESGIQQIMRHLASLGHRRIAYLGGPAISEARQRRLEAFRRECATLGLALPDVYVQPSPASIEGGREAALSLLASTMPGRVDAPVTQPTALVAYDDTVAVGVLLAARELGIPAPGQLSVVGYNDIPLAIVVTPALTTVRQPMREMGERAVTLLYNYLQARNRPAAQDTETIHIRLEAELKIRDSTATASES